MTRYLLYLILIAVVRILGRRRARAFGRFLANRHYESSPKDRRAVIRNLRCILRSRSDVTGAARRVFHHFAEYLVDFFLMDRLANSAFVARHVRVLGREHLDNALSRGKGVVILTAHIGNWEMGAAILGRLGYSVTAVALPHGDPRVNRLFNRQREKQGVSVVSTGVAVRRCIGALRDNSCVALLGDRDFSSFGELMPFLGRPTVIPKGPAFFALKTGAAIVPVFVVPERDGGFLFEIREPMLPDPVDREGDALIPLMKRCVAVIEGMIRRYPDHWLMFQEFGIEYEDLSSHTRVQRGQGARSSR